MWRLLLLINTVLLVIVICQRGIKLSALRSIEKEMATKEDLEVLNARIGDLETAFDSIAADTTALKNELKTLNENANVDLGPAIQKLEAMAARAQTIVGSTIGSDPEDNPPPSAAESGSSEPTA